MPAAFFLLISKIICANSWLVFLPLKNGKSLLVVDKYFLVCYFSVKLKVSHDWRISGKNHVECDILKADRLGIISPGGFLFFFHKKLLG